MGAPVKGLRSPQTCPDALSGEKHLLGETGREAYVTVCISKIYHIPVIHRHMQNITCIHIYTYIQKLTYIHVHTYIQKLTYIQYKQTIQINKQIKIKTRRKIDEEKKKSLQINKTTYEPAHSTSRASRSCGWGVKGTIVARRGSQTN